MFSENWASLTAFLDCATQWRALLGKGGLVWLGLDYSGVGEVLRAHGLGSEAFADIRVMETEALGPLNEAAP
ncbi:hypothetical protein EK403_03270 [Hansschlegelia zhihuaiae]|uniref:Uncharacterized protein n=1 Tax=Hansschlegelia zhihuaiae TaxID=405005 RepID=A0A4Q0MN83_9HYPH|nr:hypothetical protein EK403_03270 [Hansschlegelia zhihuaiae]